MADEMFVNSPTVGSDAPIATLSGNGGSISSGATSFNIASALPSAQQVSGYQFHAIITERPGDPAAPGEVIIIPTQSGTALSGITRAASPQSTAQSWPDGTSIYPVETAEAFENAPGLATAIASFSNVSTAQTLNSFASYPLQKVNLTGNPTITLPAGPSGKWCTGTIEWIQDATGGRTWGYAGSVQQPGGAQTPAAGANGSDLTSLLWDGSQWWILPVTSGPVTISILGMLIEGASGLAYLRQLGSQATGAAPGYTPNTSYLEIVPDTGLTGGFGFWYSPVGSTSWTSFTGGTGASGVTVSSPATYQKAAYDVALGNIWVGDSPKYVDVTAHFNSGGGVGLANWVASADISGALNTAIQTLGTAGYVAYLPPGQYNIQATVNIGNGTSGTSGSTASTWTGGLVGAIPAQTPSTYISSSNFALFTQLNWNLNAVSPPNAMLAVNGPIDGWEVSRLSLLCTNTAAKSPVYALTVTSGQDGRCEFCKFHGQQNGILLTTVVAIPSGANYPANCANNFFNWVGCDPVGPPSGGTSAGVTFTSPGPWGGATSSGNACYNVFENLILATQASSGTNYGIWFQATDSNRLHNVHIAGSSVYTHQVLYDYTAHNVWPADNVIDVIEFGNGAGPAETGSISLSPARNRIMNVSMVNGQPNTPTLKNCTWGSQYLSGTATLVAGTKTVTCQAAESGVIAGGVLQYARVSLLTPGGTLGYLQGVVGANQITINSLTSSGTVNTSDTSTVYWELIQP